MLTKQKRLCYFLRKDPVRPNKLDPITPCSECEKKDIRIAELEELLNKVQGTLKDKREREKKNKHSLSEQLGVGQ